ncbi:MAG TPA: hypothetical protein VFZ16_06085 [Hyphomicrobiaceae bacterium]|nr:hypothetical protein [Hyphomicrobiaceae bacterium]
MRLLVIAAAAALAIIVAPTDEIRFAIAAGLFVLGGIYNVFSGLIMGLREVTTVRFWIVVAGLVLVSLATLKLH